MLTLLLVVATACSLHSQTDPQYLRDLEHDCMTSANLLTITGMSPNDECLKSVPQEKFPDDFFSVFRQHAEPLHTSKWAWDAFNTGETLRENLQPADKAWFALMDNEAAWGSAGSVNQPGISLVTTALRAMPTEQPLVTDPAQPGQGFPFDHLQNSLINANEPLWLSHNSESGKWTFVYTSYATGWILSRDAASIPAEHALSWPQLRLVAFTEDGYSVSDSKGRFLFNSRIGLVLPLVEANSENFEVLVATSKNADGEATFEVASVSRRSAETIPMPPTTENLVSVASSLLGKPYGWGGLHENRDCSSTIRDLFMPFGIWLPRNSREQAVIGRQISLLDLSEKQKVELILQEGLPFATLLHKKGHILLYVGIEDGYPVVFHSVWDLTFQSKDQRTRRHVGKIVLSTLRPGKASRTIVQGSTILADLESMNVLETSSANH